MALIIALETTEKFGNVALLSGRQVLAELPLPTDQRSAQTLAPTINRLFSNPELWDISLLPEKLRSRDRILPNDIDCVAVVVGPGSFTGLRVGVATAKMFAYAAGAKIVGVKTHDTVAEACSAWMNESEQESNFCRYVSIGVDAQRGDVVTQLFHWTDGCFLPADDARLIPVNVWWEQTDQYDNLLFAGPALERWSDKAPEAVRLAEECYWTPWSEFAGKIAAHRFENGQFDDLWSLTPIYSRLSAAEEKRSTSSKQEQCPDS